MVNTEGWSYGPGLASHRQNSGVLDAICVEHGIRRLFILFTSYPRDPDSIRSYTITGPTTGTDRVQTSTLVGAMQTYSTRGNDIGVRHGP